MVYHARPKAKCPTCGATFIADRLAEHAQKCTGPGPGRKRVPTAPANRGRGPAKPIKRKGAVERILWDRDEVVVLFALYKRIGAEPDETDTRVIDLAGVLRRRLEARRGRQVDDRVRSPSSVSIKLRSFLSHERDARTGTLRGGKTVRTVFEAFDQRPDLLDAEEARILAECAKP